jgi:hemoglobin/transferrin/lactoferrin receptor protein
MEGGVESMRLSVSWQTQQWVEDRVRASGAETVDSSRVGTLGAFAQLESQTPFGRLTYGLDFYRDHVDSARRRDVYRPGDEIQGKVGDDATYDLLGVFVQDVLAVGDHARVEAGVRYTYAAVDADSVRDPSNSQRIGLRNSWDELTANVRGLVGLTDELNVYAGVSQGFRAPSLTDLTSFDIARSGEQEEPVTDLEEERFLGYEVGAKLRSRWASAQAAWFYTDIDDQILRFPTGRTNLNGDDVVTKGNVGDGYIQGFELSYVVEVMERTELFGAHSYQYGRVSNYQDPAAPTVLRDDYPSRLMPLTNVIGLRWEDTLGTFHASTSVVRAEDADKLSFRDQSDSQRIPPGGTPSYTIWNLACGWRISEHATLECALENVTDADYRVHGSGSNSLGRNFVLGMRVSF